MDWKRKKSQILTVDMDMEVVSQLLQIPQPLQLQVRVAYLQNCWSTMAESFLNSTFTQYPLIKVRSTGNKTKIMTHIIKQNI